ncbi:MAG: hypothetical protein JWO43_240 [Candidatus Adlerbacteria bacterium]|nr:hypothetical protein [Candidatus Adlerbacteria bacterium]
MQDMIPPPEGDRSIRNIPIPANHRKTLTPMSERPAENFDTPRRPASRTPRRRIWVWLGGIIILAALGVILLSSMFDSATVSVHPHAATVTATGPITASPSGTAGATLTYQTMSVNRTASSSVTASGSSQVTKTASGQVTVYNTYSTAPQQLITNTRFAAPDGKIYRIHSAITVPGTTKAADGSVKPGTVTATIYADQPGEAGNRTDATQFTIPGFQGDPRYTKFYAQSTAPIAGGFVGTQPTVAPADLATAQNTMKQALSSQVNAAITSSVPDGFIVIPGTVSVSYGEVVQTASGDSAALLTQTATGNAAMVRSSDLAQALAVQAVADYKQEPIAFADPSTVALTSNVASSSASVGPLSITISGSPALVWQFDTDAIKQALIGKPKSSFEGIIGAFKPSVEAAEATLRPFWKSSFPSDPNKITVEMAK